MANKHKVKKELPKTRNPHALDALTRHGGAMKDKKDKKSNQRNKQLDILNEYEEEAEEIVEEIDKDA